VVRLAASSPPIAPPQAEAEESRHGGGKLLGPPSSHAGSSLSAQRYLRLFLAAVRLRLEPLFLWEGAVDLRGGGQGTAGRLAARRGLREDRVSREVCGLVAPPAFLLGLGSFGRDMIL
jgi:hypothetical protein